MPHEGVELKRATSFKTCVFRSSADPRSEILSEHTKLSSLPKPLRAKNNDKKALNMTLNGKPAGITGGTYYQNGAALILQINGRMARLIYALFDQFLASKFYVRFRVPKLRTRSRPKTGFKKKRTNDGPQAVKQYLCSQFSEASRGTSQAEQDASEARALWEAVCNLSAAWPR